MTQSNENIEEIHQLVPRLLIMTFFGKLDWKSEFDDRSRHDILIVPKHLTTRRSNPISGTSIARGRELTILLPKLSQSVD
jgi:hypothetical protein